MGQEIVAKSDKVNLALERRSKENTEQFQSFAGRAGYAARQVLYLKCERKADILLDQARLPTDRVGFVDRMKCISPLSPTGDPVV